MGRTIGSARAAALATELERVAEAAIASFANAPVDHWMLVPGPGVWSAGKDAEHVAEAAVYHLWIVRKTIGERVPAARAAIERGRLTTSLSPNEAADQVRRRTQEGVDLIRSLTDEQLTLPTRPPRAGNANLASTIERVLIGHYAVHREAIEAKLRTARTDDPG